MRRSKASRTRQRRGNRGALPKHLPREEIVIEPDEQTCPCCGGAMHRIGEDIAERLDVTPAQFRVIVTRRPKYGCRACESAVVQAPAPARLIEGGLPTEAPGGSCLDELEEMIRREAFERVEPSDPEKLRIIAIECAATARMLAGEPPWGQSGPRGARLRARRLSKVAARPDPGPPRRRERMGRATIPEL